MMVTPLANEGEAAAHTTPRILFLEDMPADAELAERELRRAGMNFSARRVETADAFRAALTEFAPDLILSDFRLPQFTGLDAIRLARELMPDVPIILVTGSLTEELAVECMREGATDYILKSSLTRLPAAVLNALEKAETRRAKEQAIQALERREEQYRELFENANDLIYTHDLAGRFTSLNKAGERITGYTRAEAIQMNMADVLSPEQLARARAMMSCKEGFGGATVYDLEIISKNGRKVALELSTSLIYQDGRIVGVQGIGRDVTEKRQAEAERQVISKIIQGMGTTANLNELLQLIHESIGKVLNAENCFVALHDKSTGALAMQFFVDKHDAPPPAQAVERGRAAYVFRTGRPSLITAEVFAQLIAQGEVEARGTAPAAWLGVPLRTPSGTTGVLVVQHYEDPNAYSERDLELLSSVGGQIALAIERKRADEALRDSEVRYRQLVEFSPEAIIIHNGGVFTYVNPAAAHLFGAATSAELIGRRVMDFVHPDYRELVARRMAQVRRGQDVPLIEERLVRLDGQIVEGEVAAMPFVHNGQLSIQCFVRDLTEHKRAEAERDAERELLNALIERLPVGVLFRDESGHYARVNRRAAQILDTETDRLVGLPAAELGTLVQIAGPDAAPLAPEQLPSSVAMRTQQPVGPVEELITTAAGNKRRVIINVAPVALSEQGAAGCVVVLDDVTEQYAMQEQLRQSQKMESIGLLAGGVAHDFNNLLTAIQGNTQLALRKLKADDPIHHRLLEVEKASQRATVLTRQLLAFSRRQYLERRAINLNGTINDISKMVRRIIGEDVEVRVNEASELAPVFADPTQIEQVIMNLAVNARDAMPGGGLLLIETNNVELDAAYCRRYSYTRPGRYVQIKVSDTGEGMDTETQKRIFEPFFTTKELGKGTGLGLAMVYGIIKQHDGHIHVYSELGHGTTFKIYLPVHDQAVETEAQPQQMVLAGGTETILVAEDEEALRDLAREVLAGLGYEVLLARDGAEALALYNKERERIDLLLLDVVMPRMGGHEAYDRMRAAGCQTPVIFMTGYSAETVQSKFVQHNSFIEEAGAVLLQKPYNVESLGQRVREILDSRRKHQDSRT
ncbi:MAG: PAS domain S-box protein [Pyrinomonadaceae bacterium]